MIGIIKNLKLIEEPNNTHWLITIVDEDENLVGTFHKKQNNNIDFRNQTYGIMCVTNCMDLLKIGNLKKDYNVFVKAKPTRIEIISDEEGNYLRIDPETAELTIGERLDISGLEKRKITGIQSKSGVVFINTRSDYLIQSMSGDYSYLGFKKLYSRFTTKDEEEKGAKFFKDFITQILKICKIDDLIEDSTIKRKVQVELDDKGQIISIGNEQGNTWIELKNNEYEIIDEERYILSNTKSI